MPPNPARLLKTRQAAEALGIGVSTVKRWVDSGEIPASKTVGGHRLIALGDVLRFARERGLPVVGLDASEEGPADPVVVGDRVEALTVALRRGRVGEARSLIRQARAGGTEAAALGDDLLRPALERIGHDWEAGGLDVYQEHRASRIVEAALIDEFQRLHRDEPAGAAPLAIGSAPGGDLYTLSGLLCELTLRELGWDAMNLGANLPLGSLARAVRVHHPRLVWLTIHQVGDREQFLADYREFYRSATASDAAVILGGPALDLDLRSRLVAASFGDRLAHLAEFARRLAPAGFRPTVGRDDGETRPAP